MKKALILNNQVVDVVDNEFPVSSEMSWMDCPDECEAGWKIEGGNIVEFTAQEIADQQSALQQSLPDMLKQHRDLTVNGGITINGMQIETDLATRTSLIAVRTKAKEDSKYTVQWKLNTGFVTLDASTCILIADMVLDHVQKAFSAENTVLTQHDTTAYDSWGNMKQAFDDTMAT